MEYYHKDSPMKNGKQNTGFGWKTLGNGVIHTDFLEPRTKFNPEQYTAALN
jgi:hypothetical protein